MDNTGLMGSTISIVVTQPGAPAALTASNVLYFTADLSWTALGNETTMECRIWSNRIYTWNWNIFC